MGKCIPSVSGTAYSPVAEKGCMLNMATFAAACYDDKGAVTMNETAKLQLMADKTSMMTTVATMTTTMATRDATISTLQTDKEKTDKEKSEDKMPTWAIAIIVVIGAVLLLVVAILGVVVSREQQGKPVFVPKKSVTSGSEKI